MPGKAEAYCSSGKEHIALNTRIFQSEMMVAALACGQQQQYNEFVSRFKLLLAERGRDVRGFFMRNYGDGAEAALNRFVTRIANDAARRGLDTEENAYCDATEKRFDDVLKVSADGMDELVLNKDLESYHGIKSCDSPYWVSSTN